jgi:hypothetical protein
VPRADAAQFTLESRTFLPAREDVDENKHVLLYEYLDVGGEDLGLPGFYFGAGGWGRVDLAEETFGRETNTELQYGFVGWRAPRLNTDLRLGRVAVTGGAARNEVIDGVQIRSDLGAGVGVLAFGGVPVEADAGGRSGDSIFGGRLSQGIGGLYEIGASYLKERNDSADAREEAGADLWLRPGLPLVLSGSSLYNVDTNEFARHAYRLALDPIAFGIRVAARYSWTDYGEFFTAADASPFVFPAIDPKERLQTVGGDLELPLPGGLTLAGDYTNYRYEIADKAERYGARLDWAGAGGLAAGLGYHRSQGDAAENRYDEYSAYASGHLGPVRISLGLHEMRLAEEINGTRDALTATLAAEAQLTSSLSLGADVEYGTNPERTSEVRGLLKATWRYALDTAGKGGAAK